MRYPPVIFRGLVGIIIATGIILIYVKTLEYFNEELGPPIPMEVCMDDMIIESFTYGEAALLQSYISTATVLTINSNKVAGNPQLVIARINDFFLENPPRKFNVLHYNERQDKKGAYLAAQLYTKFNMIYSCNFYLLDDKISTLNIVLEKIISQPISIHQ